jgi:hypothetical protein
VEDFERIESAKPITMMTPEPDGGFYKDADVAAFIRKFGYADKNDRPDRLNFGGRHVVGVRCPPTGLTMRLAGFDASQRRTEPNWQYAYGHMVRLAQRTDSLRLLRAFASGAMYYNPGIKVLAHGHQPPPHRRSRRSAVSFAWRRRTSPRSTKRWRRWRCEEFNAKSQRRQVAKNSRPIGNHFASLRLCGFAF